MAIKPYNPLDYENLTINLARELMTREPVELPLPRTFPGPGAYALFYCGDYGPYARISSSECKTPIYVGKADPPGARKGGDPANEASPALFRRIKNHVSSINAAENLHLRDFRCRYLTVEPLWIRMAERFLIEHYQPIWNVCIEGFGIHNPGKGRHEGEVSWWDTLHPGRPWVKSLRQVKTMEEVLGQISVHFSGK